MFNGVFGGAVESSRKRWLLESEDNDSNLGSPIYWLSNPSKAPSFSVRGLGENGNIHPRGSYLDQVR